MAKLSLTTCMMFAVVLLNKDAECKPDGSTIPANTGLRELVGSGPVIFLGVLVPVMCGFACSRRRPCCTPTGDMIRKTVKKSARYLGKLRCAHRSKSSTRAESIEETQSDVNEAASPSSDTDDSDCEAAILLDMKSLGPSLRTSHESISSNFQLANCAQLGIKFVSEQALDRLSVTELLYVPCIANESLAGSSPSISDTNEAPSERSGSEPSLFSFSSQYSVVSRTASILHSFLFGQQLQKSSPILSENVTSTYFASALTQTDSSGNDLDKFEPKPIFSISWQAVKSFQSAGGSLTMVESDVRLEIPAHAIPPAVYVDVVVASYTDLPRVRDMLQLGPNESIMSPLVEFHASSVEHFDKPVHIFMPHGLPLSFPEEHVKIYHVHAEEDGSLQVRTIPSKEVFDRMCKRNDLQSETPRNEESGLEYGPGYFQLLPSGELIVTTTQFCGYVCTACNRYVSQVPQIYLMATSSPVQREEDQLQAEIFLYLWDRKITIKDFQRDHMVQERTSVAGKTLDLIENYQKSRVKMQLNLCGPNHTSWQHALRPDSQDPIFPFYQELKLEQMLHCRARDSPKQTQWLIETIPGHEVSPSFQCYIDVSNVDTTQADPATPGQMEKVTFFLRGTGPNTLGFGENLVGVNNRKRNDTRQKCMFWMENNSRRDVPRRPASFQSLTNSSSGGRVPNTPVGFQEEGRRPLLPALNQISDEESDIESYQLFGDGQMIPRESNPGQGLIPATRSSRPDDVTNGAANTHPDARIDNLKQCRSLVLRRGQEHDESQASGPLNNAPASCPERLCCATMAADVPAISPALRNTDEPGARGGTDLNEQSEHAESASNVADGTTGEEADRGQEEVLIEPVLTALGSANTPDTDHAPGRNCTSPVPPSMGDFSNCSLSGLSVVDIRSPPHSQERDEERQNPAEPGDGSAQDSL